MEITNKKRIAGSYQNLIFVCVGVAVVALVCFLLFMNYRFATDLRKTNLSNMKEETEKRATSVGFFFVDRKDDLINLALSREISVFFENKALGMSMEYGLKLSLLPIQERFLELINRKKLGHDAVYSRLMLIERNGTVVVDTSTTTDHKAMRGRLKEFLVPKYRDGAILSMDGGREIVASLSYFFKDHYAGQIIAWIQPQTLYRNILGEGESPSDISYLIINKAKTCQPVGVSFPPQISGLPDLAAVEPGKPFEFQNLNEEKQSWIGLKMPISGTPFHMLRFVAALNVVGRLTPKYLFTTMGLIAFVLLGSASLAVIFNLRAEETVRESEERYRNMIENSGDMIQSVDAEGKFIFVNPAWRETLGYTDEELSGLNLFQIIHPDSMVHCQGMFQKIMSGQSVKGIQATFVSKDGSPIFVEGNVAPRMAGVKVIATHGFFRDITDRKRAEEELHNTLRQLQEAKDMLLQSEKLAAVGKLSAGVAHEILNPLNIIGMRLQLLEMTEPLSDKTKEAFKIAQVQIDRITKIARDLGQFSRITAKYIATINLKELMDSVFSLVAPRLKFEKVTLDFQYQTDIPLVSLDKFRMEQVFLNLINNAIDAMKEQEEKILHVSTVLMSLDGTKNIQIGFSDNGTGIKEDIIHKIFDPFFTTKEQGKGTGLGLSICYGIIQDQGGKIWVENNEMGGATFFIELPIGERAVS